MKTPKFLSISILILLLSSAPIFQSCQEKKCCEYEDFPYECNNGMDVAFLIDYTGSMGTAIDSVKSQVNNIVNTIVSQSAGNYRLSLSIFDEYHKKGLPTYNAAPDYVALPAAQKIKVTTGPTDQYLTMLEKFSANNNTSFSNQLAKLNGAYPMGSGNNLPEPGDLLLNEILNNNFAGNWRMGITKLAIIITDAAAGGNDDNDTPADDTYLSNLAASANAQGIQCILITTLAGSNYQLQLISNNNNGSAYVLSNFKDISKNIITMLEDLCKKNAAN